MAARLVLVRPDVGRVGQAEVRVQLEHAELQNHLVQLQEGQHHAVIDVGGERLAELPGQQPRDRYAAHLGLQVDALDAEEHLPQAVRARDVVLPFTDQTLGGGGLLWFDRLFRGERSEHVDHGKSVVKVRERISEVRVPRLHDVVQGVGWPVVVQLARFANFLSSDSP